MASFFTAPRLVSLMIVVGTISCLPIQPAGQVTSASEYDYPTTMGDLANDDYQGPTVRPAPVGVILPVLVISLLLIAALVAALSACRGNPEKVGENDGEPEEQFNCKLYALFLNACQLYHFSLSSDSLSRRQCSI